MKSLAEGLILKEHEIQYLNAVRSHYLMSMREHKLEYRRKEGMDFANVVIESTTREFQGNMQLRDKWATLGVSYDVQDKLLNILEVIVDLCGGTNKGAVGKFLVANANYVNT